MKQCLEVRLDDNYYGFAVEYIQEIVTRRETTPLPDSPNFIEGLCYVREELVPLIRLKRMFQTPYFDFSSVESQLIILHFKQFGQKIGILVDEVLGIVQYEENTVNQSPKVFHQISSNVVMGSYERLGRESVLLNIQALFLDRGGHFRYRHLMSGIVSDKLTLRDWRNEDLELLEDILKDIQFPFNEITKHGVTNFISKMSYILNESIEEILKTKEHLFHQPSFTLYPKGDCFFYGLGDMYSIVDTIGDIFRNYPEKTIKIGVVSKGDIFSLLSIVFIFFMFKLYTKTLIITQFFIDGEMSEIPFSFSEKEVRRISLEYRKIFFSQEGERYVLKPNFQKAFEVKSFEQINECEREYFFLYAPNIVIAEEPKKLTAILENSLVRGGYLLLGLFEDIEFINPNFKKTTIRGRVFFVKES